MAHGTQQSHASMRRSLKRRKSLSPYKYEPIPKDGYFRYLILDPAKADEPLSGRLVVNHIDNALEFDAISYVWGKPNRIDQIACYGKSIGITASLRDALRKVRLPNTSRKLWADQICIDQGNLEERGNQVKLMGKIFSRSSTTLLWLGDAPDSEVEAIQSLVTDINNMVQPELLRMNGDWEQLPVWSLAHPIFSDERWVSFAKMTRCEWFKRVWIVQEAGLSRNPLILYGKYEFEWDRWNLVLLWVSQRGFSIAADYDVVWNALHLSRARVWTSEGSHHVSESKSREDTSRQNHQDEWSLPEVLHNARYLQATDPRDHVYAFLGHSSATHTVSKELLLIPDYTVKASKVYFDFAVRWIEWTKDLSILSYVQNESTDAIKRGHPSWVPMWDTQVSMNSISTNIDGGFYAGMELRAIPQLLNNSCLQVKGVVFDELEYISEIFNEEDFRWRDGVAHDSKTICKWKDILLHIGCSSTKVLSGKDDFLLSRAFAPLYCGSLSGYGSDADTHVAAFILSRITLSKVEVSPGLTEFLQAISTGGDPHLVESDCHISEGRRFAISQGELYALTPPSARKGDLCCIIFGASTPFIIRPVPGSVGYYQLVGESFVNRIMEGEIVKRFQSGEFKEQDIILV